MLGSRLLEQRQECSDRVDRELHLLRVTLVLGSRREAGAAQPEVGQRHDVLEQHVVDADLLDLRLVRRPDLLFARLPGLFLRAHRVTSAGLAS